MKQIFSRLITVALFGLFFTMTSAQKARAQDVEVSYQAFYENLAPYGQWVDDPEYGSVWVPNEGGDFRPYGSRGHWVMTEYGNTWVSEDPWGWAVYHYGRWTYDNYYGWVWIPGYEWAPAWVSWRYGGGYSGWAPMGPGVSVGVSYNCPESWWIFVGPQYMYQPDCYRHWRGPSYNHGYMRQTTVVNNYYVDNHTRVRYNYGPRADAIQRDTHQPVQVYRVSRMNRPGAPSVGGNTVSIYRPNINRGSRNTDRPANMIAAPRQIGRPQAATNLTPGRQPEFRQQMQRQPQASPQQPNNRRDLAPANQQQPNNRRELAPMNQPQPNNRRDLAPANQQQPNNRRELAPMNQPQPNNRRDLAPANQQQPNNRREPAPMNQPQPNNRRDQAPMNQPQPNNRRDEAPMNQPQPNNRRDQAPMNQPQPNNRREQMNQPQPQMNRPQPQQAPQPMNRPQPQQAPQRAQPAQRPQNEPQREGGGRR